MAPVMFQDDRANSSEGTLQARKASLKVNVVIKQKGLQLHEDKSVYMLFWSRKQKREASEIFDKEPLMCGQVELKEKQVAKWLGQYLSSAGLSDSVEQTVKARQGKIRCACLEVAKSRFITTVK